MKKNCLWTFVLLVFCDAYACAQTVLESLWENARTYAVDIHTAEISARYADTALEYKGSLYPISINTTVDSDFTDTYESIAWFTSISNAAINCLKLLPGSASVSVDVGYGLTRKPLDVFLDLTKDNVGYVHSPYVSVNISQGLKPFWLQGMDEDPHLSLLRYSAELAYVNKDIVEKNVLVAVTYNFLQLRKYHRLILAAQKMLDLYADSVLSAKELHDTGSGTKAAVWRQEYIRQDYLKDLNEYKALYMAAYKSLCLYCNLSGNLTLLGDLPPADIPLLSYDPKISLIRTQLSQLEAQHILDKQNNAPVLSVKGSLSESTGTIKNFNPNLFTEQNTLDWNITVSLDFSNVFSPQNKLLRENFLCNYEKYQYQLDDYAAQVSREVQYYDNLISLYEKQLAEATTEGKNRLAYFDDMKMEQSNGNCSWFDLLEAEAEYFSSRCNAENLADTLWYYRWMRTQIYER